MADNNVPRSAMAADALRGLAGGYFPPDDIDRACPLCGTTRLSLGGPGPLGCPNPDCRGYTAEDRERATGCLTRREAVHPSMGCSTCGGPPDGHRREDEVGRDGSPPRAMPRSA